MQITDNGTGFDWAKSRGLSGKPSPDSDSGWGIFLMKNRSSHLAWNQAGNQVELAFSRRELKTNNTLRPMELTSLFTG